MVERFRDTYMALEAKRSGQVDLSTRQIVTLASLVEKETGKPRAGPLVAACTGIV
jgi:cell division protein YceG involved in septum cleavage